LKIMSAADADRKVNAVLDACRKALAAISALRSPHERIDAAGQLSDRLRTYADEAARLRNEDAISIFEASGGQMSLADLAALLHVSKARADQIVRKHREARKQAAEQPAETVEVEVTHPTQADFPILIDPNAPLRPPIVAAIVTSKKGVLVERRHDGRPLWTFPAGEAEPGESPADTAIRETKEECELQIVVSHVIGERNHPKTGRHMIYLAARPYHGTVVNNGDESELAEVRWVTLAELDDLMGAGNIFEPVHEHLVRTIGS
jgi:8-oxo-dGTP diphosphatase